MLWRVKTLGFRSCNIHVAQLIKINNVIEVWHKAFGQILLCCGTAPLLLLYFMAERLTVPDGIYHLGNQPYGNTKHSNRGQWSMEGNSVDSPQKVFLER